jgi:hypothetical protein
MKMYILGSGCIAPQDTHATPLLENLHEEAVVQTSIVKPNYKEYIAPAMIRRMGKAIKMGVVASTDALKQAKCENPDAIIAGTGLGCQQDSEKFLENILKNDEQFLTPSSFIQSTHNTVAGQVALMLKCNAYNFTYCHRGFSFENTLIDAQVTLMEKPTSKILTLGIDEMTEHTRQVFQRIGWNSNNALVPTQMVHKSEGTVYGEGAAAFVLSNEKPTKEAAFISAVEMLYKPTKGEMAEKLKELNSLFDIDYYLLGLSGDAQFDQHYSVFDDTVNCSWGIFKHITGEYHTASSFATWLAQQILLNQEIPSTTHFKGDKPKAVKTILIYNYYNNLDHSFIIVQK